jgi:hypothetical protein
MSEPSDGESQALPGVAPERHDWTAGPRFTLEVRGESFAVTETPTGDNHYLWLSGPNEGYGFSEFGPPGRSLDDHRRAIRDFLRDIDPVTGFLRED